MNCIEAQLQCPYCWTVLEILVEPEPEEQQYTEDCQVCCAPILINVRLAEGEIVTVEGERE